METHWPSKEMKINWWRTFSLSLTTRLLLRMKLLYSSTNNKFPFSRSNQVKYTPIKVSGSVLSYCHRFRTFRCCVIIWIRPSCSIMVKPKWRSRRILGTTTSTTTRGTCCHWFAMRSRSPLKSSWSCAYSCSKRVRIKQFLNLIRRAQSWWQTWLSTWIRLMMTRTRKVSALYCQRLRCAAKVKLKLTVQMSHSYIRSWRELSACFI